MRRAVSFANHSASSSCAASFVQMLPSDRFVAQGHASLAADRKWLMSISLRRPAGEPPAFFSPGVLNIPVNIFGLVRQAFQQLSSLTREQFGAATPTFVSVPYAGRSVAIRDRCKRPSQAGKP